MRRSSPRLLVILGIAVMKTSAAGTARAADAQAQQLAQTLFDEGRRLMDAKHFTEACPKLAESQRLDPGGGTLLNLALCHEKQGKLATAHVDFNEALTLAVKDGRKDREKMARERIAAIEPAMPRITVTVAEASAVQGLELKVDSMVLARAAWALATPVDPGDHLVEANAPAHISWSASVALEPSQRRTITVPALRPGPPSSVTAVGAKPAEPPVANDAGATVAPPPTTKDNPFFYVVLGVTVVAAGTAGVTGFLALTNNAFAAPCLRERNVCPDQASADAASRAQTYAWVSTVSLGVAVAGAVSVLFLPKRVAATTATASAMSLPGGGGLSLTGAF